MAGRLVAGHSPFESELSGAADRNSDDEDVRSEGREGGALTTNDTVKRGGRFFRRIKFLITL